MKFRVNNLYKLALDFLEEEHPIEDKTIRTYDRTPLFFRELSLMLKNKESINININGKVRTGKSTVAIYLGKYITDLMLKYGISKRQFTIWNIARTQYEFSKRTRDPELNNAVIVVDEYDDLEDTGENATVEQALLRNFSKLQAARYIHRIYCSPNDQPDDQSDIIINVVQADRKQRVTHCTLYVKVLKGDQRYLQLVGHINIPVGSVIQNWIDEGLETLFYTRDGNPKTEEIIEKWRKVDFYVEYMCRKFEKMDMTNAMGIYRTRELDYADIFIKAIKDLKPLTSTGDLNSREIKNHIKSICREFRVPTSMIGDQLMSDKVEGVLNLWTSYHKAIKRLRELKKGKEGEEKEESFMQLNEMIKRWHELAEKQEKELETLAAIKKRYYGE